MNDDSLSLNKVMRTFGWSPTDLELQVSLCVSLWVFLGFVLFVLLHFGFVLFFFLHQDQVAA